MMPIFQVHGTVTVSCWTEVEAGSEEEALRIAKNRQVAEIHIDGTYRENECWHLDTDGTPDNLRVDL